METLAAVIPLGKAFGQLSTEFDRQHKAVWVRMQPHPTPCFNQGILEDLRRFQEQVRQFNTAHRQGDDLPIRFMVGASGVPGVFNLGGDLGLFGELVEKQDADGLRRYARVCAELVHMNAVGFHLPMTTISLVQGDALGGGFEAALSCHVLVAEEQARFGLPEVLFNLFPGMGAYNLLSRRIGAVRAERLILSGKVYTAAELYAQGVVDELVPDGEGECAVEGYMRRYERRRNAHLALAEVRSRFDPVTLEELLEVCEIWVEAALNLGPRDLRLMRRLVDAQGRRALGDEAAEAWVESDRA